ncbi:hypothetical protein ABZU75_23470 [Streptosporangium sp. NPDC005286]|uniref:hypothetical protein n=1 Tax=Streptosporangium sp. NPDC005286 TaxID=3154463 RepID=UPI0033B4F674
MIVPSKTRVPHKDEALLPEQDGDSLEIPHPRSGEEQSDSSPSEEVAVVTDEQEVEVCDSCIEGHRSEMEVLDAKYTALRMIPISDSNDCLCWFKQSQDIELTALALAATARYMAKQLAATRQETLSSVLQAYAGSWLMADALREDKPISE